MSEKYRNPLPTVDIIIELAGGGIVLIERKNPPHGWALPGGFVDYGESIENAARARSQRRNIVGGERSTEQFYTYSDPARDRAIIRFRRFLSRPQPGRRAAPTTPRAHGRSVKIIYQNRWSLITRRSCATTLILSRPASAQSRESLRLKPVLAAARESACSPFRYRRAPWHKKIEYVRANRNLPPALPPLGFFKQIIGNVTRRVELFPVGRFFPEVRLMFGKT